MSEGEKYWLGATIQPLMYEYDILFYVSPDGVEIEDNGIRETNAEYRMAIDKEIRSIIQMHGANKVITINGTVKERIEQVKNTVSQYV